jgi:hypothetical protein
MKPLYVIILMGAAAIGGGLIVRYSDHPTEITLAHSVPPTVVAPPIPPAAHFGPSNSVPVRSAPPEKPSPLSEVQKTAKPEPSPSEPRTLEPRTSEPHTTMRVRIPPDPPAVTPLERSPIESRVPLAAAPARPSPAPAPTPAPAAPVARVVATPPEPAPAPSAPEPNHATLRAGMLIAVRINEALSSNLNSPGDVFSGTLDKPLIADGFAIAERGARVRGEVIESKSAGHVSELTLRLREIVASDGQRVHLVSEPWRKVSTGNDAAGRPGNVYDTALAQGGAAVIRPATSVTFRLGETVELSEKR